MNWVECDLGPRYGLFEEMPLILKIVSLNSVKSKLVHSCKWSDHLQPRKFTLRVVGSSCIPFKLDERPPFSPNEKLI